MIRFKMEKINVNQFAILSEERPKQYGIHLQSNLKYSIETKQIGIGLNFRFGTQEDIAMLIDVFCEFSIKEEDWEKQTKGNIVTIPKNTLDYMVSQTVGVVRGILHCKTADTIFNGFVLAPLNVSELIKEDLKIEANT